MVSIQDKDGYLHCGGSIAASNRIITAAHCFSEKGQGKMDQAKIQSFKVVVGTDSPFEYQGE